jgi:hypothetical protein
MDVTGWEGLTIQFYADVAAWPLVTVDCNLDATTQNDWDFVMNLTLGDVSMFAQNAYSPGAPNIVVASHYFPGPVGLLPPVDVGGDTAVFAVYASFYASYTAESIPAGPFIPAPNLPPDPPYPDQKPYEIGPCTTSAPS